MSDTISWTRKVTYWLKVVSLGLIFGVGIQFAQGWTAPTAAPPAGSIVGPLTTSVVDQVKGGGITANYFSSPMVCIGGDCRTSWPGGAGAETDPTVQAFAKSALPTCSAGQVLKSNGTSFSCVAVTSTLGRNNCYWTNPYADSGDVPRSGGTGGGDQGCKQSCNAGEYVAAVRMGQWVGCGSSIVSPIVYCCKP